mgnify:CR=1 FL=1
MFSSLNSMGLSGIDGFMVKVEADLSQGLPGFDVVGLPGAQRPGDEGGAAHAEERSQGHEDHEERSRKRNCRHLQVVLSQSEEKCIGQIVNHHHDHGNQCRDTVPDHDFRNRIGSEGFNGRRFVSVIHGTLPP